MPKPQGDSLKWQMFCSCGQRVHGESFVKKDSRDSGVNAIEMQVERLQILQ